MTATETETWDDPRPDQARALAKEQDPPNPDPCLACRMLGHWAACPVCGTPDPGSIPDAGNRWAQYLGAGFAGYCFHGHFRTDTHSISFLRAMGLPGWTRISLGPDGYWLALVPAKTCANLAQRLGVRADQLAASVDPGTLAQLRDLADQFAQAWQDCLAWNTAGKPGGWGQP